MNALKKLLIELMPLFQILNGNIIQTQYSTKLENKMQAQKLTNLQLELLKVFSYQLNQQQLSDIKNLLANYFADQATQEMDKLWEENNWDNNTMTNWTNEHLRTPYNPS